MSQKPDVSLDQIDGQIIQFVQSSDQPVMFRDVANINPEHARSLLEKEVLIRDRLCRIVLNRWILPGAA
jgi:hypothetical protein